MLPGHRCVLFIWSVSIACCANEPKVVHLKGAGASFPREVYSQWISAYTKFRIKHVDLRMTYDSIGSGSGIYRIKGEHLPHIDYAGSDSVLTDEDKKNHADLVILPTMAGAIVIGYNIPREDDGLKLVLNLEAIVGIYNGSITRWNDSVITQLNPSMSLDGDKIVVVVRYDKSGTTAAFTSGLSSFSSEWQSVYGESFSEGLNTSNVRDRVPVHWNSFVVDLYAYRNLGMSGLILSTPYSIGYMSIADARKANISTATLKNKDGIVVEANVSTVQSSISHSNSSSFTIMNMPGRKSFPLASYTYFIVHKTNMTNCDTAIEFVRYVDWIYNSEAAKEYAENSSMVPLDKETSQFYTKHVLEKMTCNGRNVWQLVREQKRLEYESNVEIGWQTFAYSGISVLVAIVIVLTIVYTRQQYRQHKELLTDSWKINYSDIISDKDIVRQQMRINNSRNSNSVTNDTPETYMKMPIFEYDWGEDTFRVGVYASEIVTLFRITDYDLKMSIKRKKSILWMRDTIKHQNLMCFMGLSFSRMRWYIVHSGQIKGTLIDILRNPKILIQNDGLIALTKSITSGMKFLHRKGIVHGNLKGSNCLIDESWNLRIAAWSETRLQSLKNDVRENQVNVACNKNDEQSMTSFFWTAPEILKCKRGPAYASDIYSFGMVVQEMFSRKDLYSEYNMQPSDVIHAVMACSLRPRFSQNTPFLIRELLEKTWDMDPAARPSFTAIENIIMAAYPKHITVLDCMIASIEMYANLLESKIKDRDEDIAKLNVRSENILRMFAPDVVINKVINNQKVETERYQNTSVMVCMISNMDDIIYRVTLKGIVNILNTLFTGIDQILQEKDVYRLYRQAGTWAYVNGVLKPCAQHAKQISMTALMMIAFIERHSKEHLLNLGTYTKLKTGIASGSVVVGALGKLVPQYAVMGEPVDLAHQLMVNTEPDTIRIDRMVYLALKEDSDFQTKALGEKEDIYYLETTSCSYDTKK